MYYTKHRAPVVTVVFVQDTESHGVKLCHIRMHTISVNVCKHNTTFDFNVLFPPPPPQPQLKDMLVEFDVMWADFEFR